MSLWSSISSRSKWLRITMVASTAILAALALGYAISLLPNAHQPIILLCATAVASGFLCWYFLFTFRAFRHARTFRFWGVRLCALASTALILTLLLELFVCNHRAFITRECDPTELNAWDWTTADGEDAAGEDGVLRFSGTVEYEVMDLYEETVAIGVTLGGNSKPVEITAFLRDDASILEYAQACTAVCVPGVDGLNTYNGALYSNGILGALKLRLSPLSEGEYTLESVVLNPCVALVWQPLRMTLWFVGLLLLLCALRFPWRDVLYERRRLSHRLIIILPMLFMMLFSIWISNAILPGSTPNNSEPDENLLRGVSYQFARTNKWDCYGMLMCAFNEGNLYLAIDPDEALVGLANPYDPSQRADAQCNVVYDCALYENHFYVYFGILPVIMVYFPFYWLTGRVPSEVFCSLVFALLAVLLIYLAVITFARKYARKNNVFLLSLACMAVTAGSGVFLLLSSADRYHNVILSCVAMMAGALWMGYSACMDRISWRRGLKFGMCGLFFAFQGLARANTLVLTTVFLAPAFFGVLADGKATLVSRFRDAACFLLPALAGVLFILWYNFARFGSITEFGQAYQITTEDIHYNVFRWEYLPQMLWYFLFQPISIKGVFPWIELKDQFINLTGNFFYTRVNISLFAFPIMWLIPLCATCRIGRSDATSSLCRERAFTFGLPLAVSIPLMAVTFYFAGVTVRYAFDFAFSWALVASCAGILLFAAGEEETFERRILRRLISVVTVATVLVGILLTFENQRNNICLRSPSTYYMLLRMFFPY